MRTGMAPYWVQGKESIVFTSAAPAYICTSCGAETLDPAVNADLLSTVASLLDPGADALLRARLYRMAAESCEAIAESNPTPRRLDHTFAE